MAKRIFFLEIQMLREFTDSSRLFENYTRDKNTREKKKWGDRLVSIDSLILSNIKILKSKREEWKNRMMYIFKSSQN